MTTNYNDLPQPKSVRLIDFDKIDIRPGIVNGTYILIVSGMKPYLNMEVRLIPLVYVQQPEYWGIEVTGMLPGMGLPAETPYCATIPLDGIRGKKGIEVIGANKSEKREVPPN